MVYPELRRIGVASILVETLDECLRNHAQFIIDEIRDYAPALTEDEIKRCMSDHTVQLEKRFK